LATNLTLFSRLLQLPVSLRMDPVIEIAAPGQRSGWLAVSARRGRCFPTCTSFIITF